MHLPSQAFARLAEFRTEVPNRRCLLGKFRGVVADRTRNAGLPPLAYRAGTSAAYSEWCPKKSCQH